MSFYSYGDIIIYYECKVSAFSLFYVRLTIKNTLFKAFLTVQVIFWNKKHSPETQYRITSQEIHGNIFSHFCIKKDCLESASDELEYNWLEQELSEYKTHGFLWHSEELNDYLPNGFFWSNYVQFDADGWLSLANCSFNIILVDDVAKMWWEDETDISQILSKIEKDAIEKKKTVFLFVSQNFPNLCL